MSGLAAYRLLVRRLVVSRELRGPLLVPAVVALLFTAFYLMLCGFALSGQQQAQRDFGTAEHQMGTYLGPGELVTGPVARGALVTELRRRGITGVSVRLSSMDVHPDGLPQALTSGPSTVFSFREISDPDGEFPGVYHLDSGRWPIKAGEVVVTPVLQRLLRSRSEFTAFSGLARFTVVGVTTNRFGTDSQEMLAGPGTWMALPGRVIGNRYVGTSAELSVYWKSGSPDVVAQVLSRVVPTHPPVDTLMTGFFSRTIDTGNRELSLVDTAGFVFSIPLFLLAIAGAAMCGRSMRGWVRRVVSTGVGIGLSRRGLLVVVGGLTTAAVMASSLVGLAGGVLLGQLLRLVLAAEFLTRPLGPVRSLWPLVAVLLLTGATVVPAVVIDPSLPGRGRTWWNRLTKSVPWSLLRRVVALVLLVRTALCAGRGLNTLDAVAPVVVSLVAAALLVVPDLLRALVRVLPVARPRGLLSRRLLESDRTRFAVMALLVAACVAVPTATSTFVATQTRTEAAMNVSLVPKGQLWVTTSEMGWSSPGHALIAHALKGAPRSRFGTAPVFTDGYVQPESENFDLGMVDSAEDLRRAIGSSLNPESIDLLERGGVLVWNGGLSERHIVLPGPGTMPPTTLPTPCRFLPGVPSEYRHVLGGVMLTATARRLHLKIAPMMDVYPDVSDQQIRDVLHLFEKTGYDTHPLQYRVVPPPTKPTRDWYTAMIGLLLIAALVLGSLMRAHGEHLRGYGARFLSLGLGRRWVIGVALVEFGVVMLAGGVVAAAAGFGAVALVATSGTSHLVLDVPYGFVALNISSVLALSVLALLFSLRTVTARERAG